MSVIRNKPSVFGASAASDGLPAYVCPSCDGCGEYFPDFVDRPPFSCRLCSGTGRVGPEYGKKLFSLRALNRIGDTP